ncbi:hypothetical protein LAZ40_13270 [Cereibacter sphaeroides]|uniref:hypothetical protein n=1 Tax=Cereibacter sphaeroides TaxID=1063 RepID=UPI001F3D0BA8|nr:hypothetical protein [Cereibacter sphaeroides]MCE6959992.1 hypothetical protein [Cereibacter sphaeroides]MCE6973077.1 hypothetical protein [Cereibacter sphaeroides]
MQSKKLEFPTNRLDRYRGYLSTATAVMEDPEAPPKLKAAAARLAKVSEALLNAPRKAK